MSDGFEDNAEFVAKSNGFVGDSGGERAPGNGWEYEPHFIHSQTKVSWRCRLRRTIQRLTSSFGRH